jgi:predicted nucleic acid-binding protein
MATVYIETTIPSFYYETRTSAAMVALKQATRRWWDHLRHHYDLVTSEFVFAELRRGPAGKANSASELLAGVQILEDRPEAREVAAYYIEHKLMPQGAAGDAAHLAMASVHGVEFLLTWNCTHLANANKATHLRVLNTRLGIPVPIITTPLSLVPETAE